jgi:uncharacterized protein YkwD
MTSFQPSSRRRRVAAAVSTAAVAGLLLASLQFAGAQGPSPAAQRGSACAKADAPAADLRPAELRKAVRCLINDERVARGRAKLTRVRTLQTVAQKHAVAMVATGCLAHRCGEEDELEERIRRAGYFEGADAWQYAESTGCGVSAEAMVTNWMAHGYHRTNLLAKTYSDVGVGAVPEPVESRCEGDYATFAVVFGWRTPPAA